MVGCHPIMTDLHRLIVLVARSDSTVMILVESGPGKEMVAEAIHGLSAREADHPADADAERLRLF